MSLRFVSMSVTVPMLPIFALTRAATRAGEVPGVWIRNEPTPGSRVIAGDV